MNEFHTNRLKLKTNFSFNIDTQYNNNISILKFQLSYYTSLFFVIYPIYLHIIYTSII